MELWNAFLGDYGNEVHNWPLRFTLEAFYHFCQDGNNAVDKFFASKGPPIDQKDYTFGEALKVLKNWVKIYEITPFKYKPKASDFSHVTPLGSHWLKITLGIDKDPDL